MQDHHSLVYREEEREMFPTLNHFGMGIIPWSPLSRGLLTRPFKTDEATTRGNTDPCVSLDALCAIHLTPLVLTDSLLIISKEQVPRRSSIGPFLPAWLYDFWSHEGSNRVEEISKKRGISMAQVSLAWSLTRVTAPVIGSTSIKNLEELISACNHYMLRDEANPKLLCRRYRDHADARRDSVFRGAVQGTLSDGTRLVI